MGVIRRQLGAIALSLLLLLVPISVAPARAQASVEIPAIQGEGDRSPFAGQTVTDVMGIVTDVAGNIGFYLQDPTGDGNARTSDALFVYTDGPVRLDGRAIAVGDGVAVTGLVAEFPENSPVSLTEIIATEPGEIQLLAPAQALPAVTVLGSATRNGFESLEGMHVRVENPVVVASTMGQTFALVEPAGLLVNPAGQTATVAPGDRFAGPIEGTLAYLRSAEGYAIFASAPLPPKIAAMPEEPVVEIDGVGPEEPIRSGEGPIEIAGGTIFPGLQGRELRDRLVAQFREQTRSDRLDYDDARTILYGRIDNENGALRGVYTGLTVDVPFGSPTARRDAFQDNRGINAEHTWPQSKGARQEPARSDMHHLFPTWTVANSTRGSLPFADIDDRQTDKWLGDNRSVLATQPTNGVDTFSEALKGEFFEPPEAHKGNVARAMFYFYTMYREAADAADSRFFSIQKDTLCRWHAQDPADVAEIERSNKIREAQGNDNPFAIDPTLADRLYCNS